MKEIHDILEAYERHFLEGKRMALATVVLVEGSSYRQPGARMLVTENGELTGAISGGCLEGDALRKARLAISQGTPSLVKYDTMDDDDAKLGVGLGCNGIIHILLEPIDASNPLHPLVFLQMAVKQRQKAVVVTMFSLQNRKAKAPGTCLLYLEKEAFHAQNLPPALLLDLQGLAAEAFAQEVSQHLSISSENQELTVFVEVLLPAPALFICGAGNDVMPLVHMANLLGWPTTVIDGRSNYATTERFPSAQQVLVAKPAQVLSQVQVDNRSVFLLLTHNYNYDLAMLRQLLPLSLKYIGVLGPKKKLDRLLQELREEGADTGKEQLRKIFGPVGLDLGAETSEEIALSIIGEIKAVFSNKKGGFLRDLTQPIHATKASAVSVDDFSSPGI